MNTATETVRYAVRKTTTPHDYIQRWCVVVIRGKSVRRVKFTTSADLDSVREDAAERNAAAASVTK